MGGVMLNPTQTFPLSEARGRLINKSVVLVIEVGNRVRDRPHAPVSSFHLSESFLRTSPCNAWRRWRQVGGSTLLGWRAQLLRWRTCTVLRLAWLDLYSLRSVAVLVLIRACSRRQVWITVRPSELACRWSVGGCSVGSGLCLRKEKFSLADGEDYRQKTHVYCLG